MGQTRGYDQVSTVTPQQGQYANQALAQGGQNQQQAAAGFQQFLPGGGGGQPIIDAAQKRYQQQTIPSIMNAFGSGSKGSGALNQALAASAGDLNTNIASQLAGMQLQAAGGLGNLGLSQGGQGQQSQFALQPQQMPFWQQAILSAIGGAGGAAGGFQTGGGLGALAGGLQGIGAPFTQTGRQ